MSTKEIKNLPASIRARLHTLAKERNEDFTLTLTKFAQERVLYRISQSKYSDQFTLKGALVFEIWTGQTYRPTRDADFLSQGGNEPERFREMFKEICDLEVEADGLTLRAESVRAEKIKEDADYEGVRVTLVAELSGARIPVQLDIGFGDAVTPKAEIAVFPTMLDQPPPKLLAYPRETVIAEKFEAMVKLGIANSRMKDFHDVYTLAQRFGFSGATLAQAINKTLERRRTNLPGEAPMALTPEFYENVEKQAQWKAYQKRNSRYIKEEDLETVVVKIKTFLGPVIEALHKGTTPPYTWKDGKWS